MQLLKLMNKNKHQDIRSSTKYSKELSPTKRETRSSLKADYSQR